MNPKDNPYASEDKVARCKPSVVSFLDLLGFREMHIASKDDPKATQELLTRLRTALDEVGDVIKDKRYPEFPWKGIEWFTKSFTDNFVTGQPLTHNHEVELGFTIERIASLQLGMIRHGFSVRGAVTLGDVYLDDDIAFGEGLIEAYKGENELARDPRVVVSSVAMELAQVHGKYYGGIEHSPYFHALLRDVDGQVFINYLKDTINDPEDGGIFLDSLRDHKLKVETNLKRFVKVPKVWSKYQWVANYHDWFIHEHRGFLKKHTDELMIDGKLRNPGPTRIA